MWHVLGPCFACPWPAVGACLACLFGCFGQFLLFPWRCRLVLAPWRILGVLGLLAWRWCGFGVACPCYILGRVLTLVCARPVLSVSFLVCAWPVLAPFLAFAWPVHRCLRLVLRMAWFWCVLGLFAAYPWPEVLQACFWMFLARLAIVFARPCHVLACPWLVPWSSLASLFACPWLFLACLWPPVLGMSLACS